MSKIAEKIHNVALQKAEEYSKTHGHTIIEEVVYGRGYKTAYIECYDQAMQDIFNYLEANIPCGEMSSEDVRDFIIECKEYFK